MDEELKILHIIGKVGVGKSTFIRKFLGKNEIFDIKEIYEQNSFNPEDLMDSSRYLQFYSAIEHYLANYIRSIDGYLIIESSGLNKAINDAIRRYPRFTILISGDIDSKIYKERPYSKKFNEFFLKKMQEKAIKFDIEINRSDFGEKQRDLNANESSWFSKIPDEYKRAFR